MRLLKTHVCFIFDVVINNKNYEAIKAFGKKLKEVRISKGLSQEDLANLADIPISQVGRIERGEINSTLSTITILAKALTIEIAIFFEK